MKRTILISIIVAGASMWLATTVHSIILMVQVFVHQEAAGHNEFPLSDYLQAGLVRCLAHPETFALSKEHPTWSGAMHIAYMLIPYGAISMLLASRRPSLRNFAALYAAVIIVLFAIASMRLLAPIPIFFLRVLVLAAMTGVGLLMNLVRIKLIGDAPQAIPIKPLSPGKRPRAHRLGFTLVEILVVIAILLVLTAISVAIYGRTRNSAYVTREINQVRQIYLAVNLYEADFDGASPPMLEVLDGGYLREKHLTCPSDERLKRSLQSWPANPWINIAMVDPPELRDARSPVVNSYFYLKTFEARFPKGRTYDEYRSEPDIGLIAGAGPAQVRHMHDGQLHWQL